MRQRPAEARAGLGAHDSDEDADEAGGGMYSEEDIVLIMEFASLGRPAAIELLHEFGGNTEAVLANMFP